MVFFQAANNVNNRVFLRALPRVAIVDFLTTFLGLDCSTSRFRERRVESANVAETLGSGLMRLAESKPQRVSLSVLAAPLGEVPMRSLKSSAANR
jgi:hypothetical protein